MKIAKITLLVLATMFAAGGMACAEDETASGVETGCLEETDKYCSEVTLGEGRLLACYYAHEDKLSSGCVNALYDAAEILNAEINALADVAETCMDDIDKFCANTEFGDGRIAKCLGYHSEELSEACSTSIDEYFE